MVRTAADSKIEVVVFTNRGAGTLFICVSYRMDTLSGGGGLLSGPLAFQLTWPMTPPCQRPRVGVQAIFGGYREVDQP